MSLGAAAYKVNQYDSNRFEGDFQFSPAAQLTLSTPALLNHWRARGAIAGQYFHSEEGALEYTAQVWEPQAMLVFQSWNWQVELGEMAHLVYGDIDVPTSSTDEDFSNYYTGRGFLHVQYTHCTGWFLRASGNASMHPGKWHRGPTETQLGFTIGYQKRPQPPKAKERWDRYFPAVPNMRHQQDDLQKEIHK